MPLSPLYLATIQAAERVGEERGLQKVRDRENAKGMARLIVRLLTRRFGSIEPDAIAQIQQLSITQLNDLGDALLDFTSLADLAGWLAQN